MALLIMEDHKLHDEMANLKSGNDVIDAGRSIATILFQVVLAKATDLARVGRYSEAEGILAEMSVTATAKATVLLTDLRPYLMGMSSSRA